MGYHPIYYGHFTIDILRFTIIAAFIVLISIVSNYYLPFLIIRIKKALLPIYRILMSNRIISISVVLIFLSLAIFVDFTIKENNKVRNNFYSVSLTDNLSSIIVNKGQPFSKTYAADSAVSILEFRKNSGWYSSYSECFIYMQAGALLAVISDGECEHHKWSFNKIVEKYGTPTTSWVLSDGAECHAYKKYNLLFRMVGNGRENQDVESEGMIDYEKFVKWINSKPK